MMKPIKVVASVILFALSANVSAQDLVYEPINPSFGGNAFNSAHLLALANAQNDFERPVDEGEASSELDRFIRSLQSRLLSSLSTQVANSIFGENAQDEGTIVFGDQTISFVRTLEGIELTITDSDGTVTTITIPTLITASSDEGETPTSSTSSKLANTAPSLSNRANLQAILSGAPLSEPPLLSPIQDPIK